MFVHLRRDRRDRMAPSIFFHGDAEQNHQHDERNDAFFLRSEDEKIHGVGLAT